MTRREKQILSRSQALGRPDTLPCMLRVGIESENTFGVAVSELRRVAMDIGQALPLALALWCSGAHEVILFASTIAVPKDTDLALAGCLGSGLAFLEFMRRVQLKAFP